jgi:spore coat protein CotH
MVSCVPDNELIFPDDETEKPGDKDDDEDSPQTNPDYPDTSWATGELDWVFDMNELPEIRITVSEEQWNALLEEYDRNSNTAAYIHCDAEFKSKGETHNFIDAGLRLRGNTSRRRPEGNGGEMHKRDNADWHHCHFMLNLRKYQKDDAHELHNIRKLHLKWHKDDRAYCRELYCYDLFRRFGIWTAAYSSYCRLWIHVEGDKEPAYYGVYAMLEAIDDKFVKRRKELFGDHDHNLWRCRWGATLNYNDIKGAWISVDDDTGNDYVYELKSNTDNFEAAKEQLYEFSKNLTQLEGQEFHDWIAKVCDVRLLLRTYAVNVVVGMWDDYWNNCNNYYIYFNSSDKENYKFFFIPYDYDNTLGTSHSLGIQTDAGRQDPYNWGDTGLLMERLMKFEDFRQIYKDALQELVDPANGLFHMDASVPRIKAWQDKIAPYVSNDTGEDMRIEDRPANWGNHGEYRLMDTGSNNYFRVKTETINRMK